jgi:hypothetical protein
VATAILTSEVTPVSDPTPLPCTVPGCERVRYARQPFCEPHYRRLRRTGELDAARPVGGTVRRECMAQTCTRVATERGLCHGHYLRLVRHGHLGDERELGRRKNGPCTVAGCTNQATARGLCPTHRTRQRTHGDVRASVPVRRVDGTGNLNHGYWRVPVPPELRRLTRGRTSELQHRLVMAQMLGRPLRSDESVHHRNGDRLCNEPDNLELWSRWQPSGQRVSDKLAFAIQLLEVYLPHVVAARTRRRSTTHHDQLTLDDGA